MKKILVVDDEVQILKSFSRMFLETDYEIFTADNGMAALILIESNNIDMVISDMRMPLLDGYKFLYIVKEKYPNIIRIVLSGYAEEKSMFKAILHNVAKMYFFKPWNNDNVISTIDKLFAADIVLNSVELMKMIEDMGCTNMMPENCNNLLTLIEDENIEAFMDKLEQDTEVSTILMQVAKSAIYGVMPNTVRQAAVYIGMHNLKCFLHWACVISVLKSPDNINFDLEPLWQHSYLSNRIFLFLYEAFLHQQPIESGMFAGLMHNIGLLILTKSLQKKGDITQEVLSLEDYYNLEHGEYILNHEEIGAHFLEMWDLPFPMYEVSLFHHRPLSTSIINKELVACVNIAQHYAYKTLGIKNLELVTPGVFDLIKISQEDFENKLSRYLKQH